MNLSIRHRIAPQMQMLSWLQGIPVNYENYCLQEWFLSHLRLFLLAQLCILFSSRYRCNLSATCRYFNISIKWILNFKFITILDNLVKSFNKLANVIDFSNTYLNLFNSVFGWFLWSSFYWPRFEKQDLVLNMTRLFIYTILIFSRINFLN